MALSGLIHGILFIFEDLFVWFGAKLGIPWWVVLIAVIVIFIIGWKYIYGGIRWLLKKIGF